MGLNGTDFGTGRPSTRLAASGKTCRQPAQGQTISPLRVNWHRMGVTIVMNIRITYR